MPEAHSKTAANCLSACIRSRGRNRGVRADRDVVDVQAGIGRRRVRGPITHVPLRKGRSVGLQVRLIEKLLAVLIQSDLAGCVGSALEKKLNVKPFANRNWFGSVGAVNEERAGLSQGVLDHQLPFARVANLGQRDVPKTFQRHVVDLPPLKVEQVPILLGVLKSLWNEVVRAIIGRLRESSLAHASRLVPATSDHLEFGNQVPAAGT